MGIYVFGDIHGDLEIYKLGAKYFRESKSLTENDYIVVCGDFGFPFYPSDVVPESSKSPNQSIRSSRKSYIYWMKWLAQKPYQVLFVDGNHDNHPYWNALPTEEWHGGLINRSPDAPNVIHLKRGECFEIEGHTLWAFGGAASHDKEWRQEGISWWPEEIATQAEMRHGLDTLALHENKVDYILTHALPRSLLPYCGFQRIYVDPVSNYLEEIYQRAQFKTWFCGHYHIDIIMPELKVQVLYDKYAFIGPASQDGEETVKECI